MPIETCHPEYACRRDDWQYMRDVIKGHKAIQKGGTKYLPQLDDQTQQEYEAYKKRATFFNATARVSDAMVGMVFRKDPQIKKPTALDEILKDMTLSGVTFQQFAQSVVKDCLDVNRCGVLVDYPVPDASGGVLTVARAEASGIRVYATKYDAEQIINWRTSQVGGKKVLSLVVLKECVQEVDPADKYSIKNVEQYRELILESGAYIQRVWQVGSLNNDGKVATQVLIKKAEYRPKKNGVPLTEIPFTFFSSKGNEVSVEDPLLYDMAVVNVAHFRNDADLEHGLHFTGLPVPWISGVKDTNQTFKIGSTVAWLFANKDAKVGYLEFTGEGLKQLRDSKKDKEEQMAALGARMLAPDKADAEAAETVAMRRQGETSMLGGLSMSCSQGLTRVLQFMADWAGIAGEIEVQLNTDYVMQGMAPQTITALLQAAMTGKISSRTFYEALVKGEVIAGTRDFEEEQVLIDEDAASNPPVNDNQPISRGKAA